MSEVAQMSSTLCQERCHRGSLTHLRVERSIKTYFKFFSAGKIDMVLSQLIKAMVYQANALGSKSGDADEQTAHKDKLKGNSGISGISEKRLYKNAVSLTYKHQKGFLPKWPDKWFEQTIADVAAVLFAQEEEQS